MATKQNGEKKVVQRQKSKAVQKMTKQPQVNLCSNLFIEIID